MRKEARRLLEEDWPEPSGWSSEAETEDEKKAEIVSGDVVM